MGRESLGLGRLFQTIGANNVKRYIATMQIEVEAETPAGRDSLLSGLQIRLSASPAREFFPDTGTAEVRGAKIGRVRAKTRAKR